MTAINLPTPQAIDAFIDQWREENASRLTSGDEDPYTYGQRLRAAISEQFPSLSDSDVDAALQSSNAHARRDAERADFEAKLEWRKLLLDTFVAGFMSGDPLEHPHFMRDLVDAVRESLGEYTEDEIRDANNDVLNFGKWRPRPPSDEG